MNAKTEMLIEKAPKLKDSAKLLMLRRIFSGQEIASVLDELDIDQIIEAKKFIWEKTLEIGIKTCGKNFDSSEITAQFTPIAAYQKQMRCNEPPQKCMGIDCFKTNPQCAIKRTRQQLTAMCEKIDNLLGIRTVFKS